MTRVCCRRASVLAILWLATVASTALAQPRNHVPASALLFPLFDSSDGAATIITVTNTNTSAQECAEHRRAGDVLLHYQYIDGVNWQEFDRFEWLAPGDTLSVRSDLHNPEGEIGFLLVSAQRELEPMAFVVSDFDYLVGSAIVVRASDDTAFRYVPYSFQAVAESPDECTIVATDLDADGALDFDGAEYVKFPREVIVDTFFQEGPRFGNELVLVTTARSFYQAELEFLLLNNEGQLFTGALQMNTFWSGAMSDLTPVATELGGDPLEFAQPSVETGWLSVRGRVIFDGAGNPIVDAQGGFAIPPIVGLFVQRIEGARDFATAHVLMQRGSLDGLELVGGDNDPQDNSGL